MLNLLSYVPARVKVVFLYTVIVIGFLWKWINTSLWGLFILSTILYLFAESFGLPKPYNFSQLMAWVVGLPSDHKFTLVSSLLTILGFLIAFHIATKNWKDQMNATLRLEVANDIENFFDEVTRHLIDISLYAKSLSKAVDTLRKSENRAEIDFLTSHYAENASDIVATRTRLMALSREVYRLEARYSLILSATWGARSELRRATEAFEKIVPYLWIRTPTYSDDDPNPKRTFFTQVDSKQCDELVRVYEENFDIINGMSGGVRGNLLSKIIEPNAATIFMLLSEKNMISEYLDIRK